MNLLSIILIFALNASITIAVATGPKSPAVAANKVNLPDMPPEILHKISNHLPSVKHVVAFAGTSKDTKAANLAAEIHNVKRDCGLCNNKFFPTLELLGFPSRSCADSVIALNKRFPIKTLNLILPPKAPGNLDLVAEIVKTAKIVNLSLHMCLLSSNMLAPIVQLLRHSELTFLNLSGNHIGNTGALAIAGALPGSKLKSLDLGWGKILDGGTRAIAAALQRSKLTLLNFGGNFPSLEGNHALHDAAAASKVTLDFDHDLSAGQRLAIRNSWRD